MAKKKITFTSAAEAATTEVQEQSMHKGGVKASAFSRRLSSAEEAKKTVRKKTLRLKPEECIPWKYHNRTYQDLNQENCQDIIDGLRATGRQEIPALVRAIENVDPTEEGPRYEIIAGARRHWSVNHLRQSKELPDLEFLVEVRKLSDQEAFILSNVENLSRKDISAYERALDYKNAIEMFYHNSQKEMSEKAKIPKSTLSKYLLLSTLPKWVIQAYPTTDQIGTQHAKPILDLIDRNKASIEEQVSTLKAEHRRRVLEGEAPMKGSEVLSKLKAAGKKKPKPKTVSYGPGNNPDFMARRVGGNRLQLDIRRLEKDRIDTIVKAFRQCLEDHCET